MAVAKARAIPSPPTNPETQACWDAASQGKLLIKRCAACGESHWYPRALCPFCGSDRTEWQDSAGRGVIYSYSVMRRATPPYVLAYVTLDEGLRVSSSKGTFFNNFIKNRYDFRRHAA